MPHHSNGLHLTQPPKHGNWAHDLPEVHRWAYDYSVPGQEQDFTPQTVPASEVPVGRDHGIMHEDT